MFDASADGWAGEVIAGEVEAGEGGAEFFEGGETRDVAEVVLRQGARPDGDIRKDRLISNREQRRDFAVDERGQFFGRLLNDLGISGAADEAGEKRVAFWGAAGEEGRIPDAAEPVQSRRTGNQEAKTCQVVTNIGFAIAERDDGDGGIFNGAQLGIEFGVELRKNASRANGRICEHDALGIDGFFAAHGVKADVKAGSVGFVAGIEGSDAGDFHIAGQMIAEILGEGADQDFVAVAESLERRFFDWSIAALGFPGFQERRAAANQAALCGFRFMQDGKRGAQAEFFWIARVNAGDERADETIQERGESLRRTKSAMDSSGSGGWLVPRRSRTMARRVPPLKNGESSMPGPMGTFWSLPLSKT